MEIIRQTMKVMTFIFKKKKFNSPTIKQSVTSPINGNKSRNQERDNGYYRLIIGDKKKMAETDAMNKYLNVISKVIVMPIV